MFENRKHSEEKCEDFVLLPERFTLFAFSPSALNSMRFSKAPSAHGPVQNGHLRVLLLRMLKAISRTLQPEYLIMCNIIHHLFRKCNRFYEKS